MSALGADSHQVAGEEKIRGVMQSIMRADACYY